MSGHFEAQPGALGAGASRAGALGGELASLRGALGSARAGAAAAGAANAVGALEGVCDGWAQALAGLQQRASELDRNLAAAGGAYAQTDSRAMPGGR